MEIFLSWSGELSHKVAKILQEYLPNIIQGLPKPFLSSEDIKQGTRWPIELGLHLEKCSFGILCLTRDNMHSPWLLFESGALSKRLNETHLIPLLINTIPSDLIEPLQQFQASTLDRKDMLKLTLLINEIFNKKSVSETVITNKFHKLWPDLNKSLLNIIKKTPDRLVLSKIQSQDFNTILCIKESCIIANVLQMYFQTLPTQENRQVIESKPLIQELKRRLEPFAESSDIKELKSVWMEVTKLINNLDKFKNNEIAKLLTNYHKIISRTFWKFHDKAGMKRGDV